MRRIYCFVKNNTALQKKNYEEKEIKGSLYTIDLKS